MNWTLIASYSPYQAARTINGTMRFFVILHDPRARTPAARAYVMEIDSSFTLEALPLEITPGGPGRWTKVALDPDPQPHVLSGAWLAPIPDVLDDPCMIEASQGILKPQRDGSITRAAMTTLAAGPLSAHDTHFDAQAGTDRLDLFSHDPAARPRGSLMCPSRRGRSPNQVWI
ncbi:hypothetical protein CKO28_00165 [Rhodovibrio sodomensis]|uniref:Uncharacterized protein n=1 Tax=Rhodovibrio sodomensis TaxID=1088 RepID=A0ABS1DA24_9PROT|nr:hypothetical protein [Rhodovibrio sodomensis]MBK1666453.1 hypothetical protein [Rhodovibrio sodomensis]